MTIYAYRPKTVEAEKWPFDGNSTMGFVVRPYPYANPDRAVGQQCQKCSQKYAEHGWVEQDGGHTLVCPGDYIYRSEGGRDIVVSSGRFEAMFEEIV